MLMTETYVAWIDDKCIVPSVPMKAMEATRAMTRAPP